MVNTAEILADMFHLTYEVGTPTDTAATIGANGKPTWYSALAASEEMDED